jgi:ubiquinone biosynthesis protein UbiJ
MAHFLLEIAINKFCNNANLNLSDLDGQRINLKVAKTPFETNFIFLNNRVHVLATDSSSSDAEIFIEPKVVKSLFNKTPAKELLKKDEIKITGNVKSAQLLLEVIEQVDFDIEEIMANIFGDMPSQAMIKAGNLLKENIDLENLSFEKLKQDFARFVVSPTKDSSAKS